MLEFLKKNYPNSIDYIKSLERRIQPSNGILIGDKIVIDLLKYGSIKSNTLDKKVLHTLTRSGACRMSNGTVNLVDAGILMSFAKRLNQSELMQMLYFIHYMPQVNLDKYDMFVLLDRFTRYKLPCYTKNAERSSTDALALLAYRGLNPFYDVTRTVEALGMDYSEFDALVLEANKSPINFAYGTNSYIEDSYTLFYLMNYFNVTCESLDLAIFVPYKDFVTIDNYENVVPLSTLQYMQEVIGKGV